MIDFQPESVHLEMLRRFPELGEDFGFEEVVGTLSGWVVEHVLDEQALQRAFAFVELAASDDDPRVQEQVARPIVEDFESLYGRERTLRWLGPAARRLVEWD